MILSLLLTATATAAYRSDGTIGSLGSAEGQFKKPGGLAVNDDTGDLYVADVENFRVQRFDANGDFVSAWGWGVDDGSSAYQVCTSGCQEGISGSEAGQFANLRFIAVDNSGGPSDGSVYVAEGGSIQKFDPEGNLVTSWGVNGRLFGASTTFSNIGGIAVDRNGMLHVSRVGLNQPVILIREDGSSNGQVKIAGSSQAAGFGVDSGGNFFRVGTSKRVEKVNSGGVVLTNSFDPCACVTGLLVDLATDDVFANHGTEVFHFGNDGSLLEQFGSGTLTTGTAVAIRPSTAAIYVSETTANAVQVFDAWVHTGPADNIDTTSALVQGRINPGGIATEYQFEYGTTTSYGSSVPLSPGSVGSGSEDVDVSATLTGLDPGALYHYRVNAIDGVNGTTHGVDRTFRTASPPKISAGATSQIGFGSAKVQAWVNPAGLATTYHFEYGTTPAYGKSAPAAEGQLAAGAIDRSVSTHLSGLQPDTLYHWRIVAQNSAGTTAGAGHAFRTFEAPSGDTVLPDGRVFEQVSPQNKEGAELGNAFGLLLPLPGLKAQDVFTSGLSMHSSADGESVEYASNLGAFANPKTAGLFGQYLATRSSDDWSTQSLDPPFDSIGDVLSVPSFFAFTPDLTKALFFESAKQPRLDPDAPGGPEAYYVRDNLSGTYKYVADPKLTYQAEASFEEVSDDLEHILFIPERENEDELTEAYLNEEGKYQTRAVTVLPDESISKGYSGGGPIGPVENSISNDGSRIVFNDLPGSFATRNCYVGNEFGILKVPLFNSCTATPQNLYVRENGMSTRLISDYAPGVPIDPEAGAVQHYWGADEDVTKIFFSSQAKLTADSTASHDAGDGFSTGSFGDLYRYDLDANGGSGELIDITVDNMSPEGAQVIGVLGNSDDGDRIYFVARSNQLDGEQGAAGQANLYLWDYNDGSPTTTFVATLQALTGSGSEELGDFANWSMPDSKRSSEVTPDGRYLQFTSKNQLTSFDNGGYNQIYFYDAQADRLACASCGGDEPATGDSFVPFTTIMEGVSTRLEANAISDDGRWVFFTSVASLNGGDSNGVADAYQYNTQTGKISLLSSGRSSTGSFFQAASPDGHDAFFTTQERLVHSDIDASRDVYDARIGGGLASQQGKPAPTCEGDSCQPPPVVPSDPTPASATFSGPGNLEPKARKQQSGKKRKQRAQHGKRKNGRKRGRKVKNGRQHGRGVKNATPRVREAIR